MSLINDALRRASNAAPASAVPPVIPTMELPPLVQNVPDPSLPPLREPVEESKSKLPIVLAALFIFCALGATAVYLWEKKRSARATAEGSAVNASAPTMTTVSARELAAAPEPQSVPATPAPAPAASAPSAPVAATPVPLAPVTFPPLRLQGIYYKPSNPSVMINGRTLYVNDEIQGVTVAAIDPTSVTLVLSGRTNVLTLR